MKQSEANELTIGSTLLNDKYVLKHLLGQGSFGSVYKGISTQLQNSQDSPQQVAVKVENTQQFSSQLTNEIQVLKKLNWDNEYYPGFSNLYGEGVENGRTFMIMDLLGPNLQDLLDLCGGKFTLKTTLMLAIQIFQRLETVHDNGYVYRDVKPQNFVMGIGSNSSKVYLIDFGLCKRYKDDKTGLLLPYKENVSMAGTVRYCSVNVHLGIEQSRRDDLESAFYLLVYFLQGDLPWQRLVVEHKFEKDHIVTEFKLKLTTKVLCEGLPQQLCNVFQYIKNLDFFQNPDYKQRSFKLGNGVSEVDTSLWNWQMPVKCTVIMQTNALIGKRYQQEQYIKQIPQISYTHTRHKNMLYEI